MRQDERLNLRVAVFCARDTFFLQEDCVRVVVLETGGATGGNSGCSAQLYFGSSGKLPLTSGSTI